MIAVPLGILGAVYLHEYGKTSAFARLVRFMAMVMTGVPSIVMGLFVYVLWTMRFGYSAFGGREAFSVCPLVPNRRASSFHTSATGMSRATSPTIT